MRKLEDIKHSDRVVDAIRRQGPMFPSEIQFATNLSQDSVRRVIDSMNRHGYLRKDAKGRWVLAGDSHGRVYDAT